MVDLRRDLEPVLLRASRAFPAVVLTGPRRSGKTYLLRHAFPRATYRLLEDPDVLATVRADPRGFLDDLALPAILDEIQNAPQLLPYVRTRIDAHPKRKGQWLLTGSQDFSLMTGVTESMAGRAAVLQLLPLSVSEVGRWDLLRGGFPEIWLRPRAAATWFRSYVQTYLERDVRAVTAVRDLATFRTFLSLLASRSGQILNKTDIAAPLGVSVPTVTQWIGVLETTGLVLVVRPYFENFGKRLIKSPRIYVVDTGLLCHLLGLDSLGALERSPFLGPVFESFVAQEIAKAQVHRGRAREIYFFRDEQGLEIDFVVPRGGALDFIEAKWTKTPTANDAKPLSSILRAVRKREARGFVVSRADVDRALVPGVRAIGLDALLERLRV
jgi:predicted AAA+ superfamily ATPase